MPKAGLAERIRKLRIERGLTQGEVAEPAYTPAYISTIEAGKRNPSARALHHIAAKLGVTVDELESGVSASFEAETELRMQQGWEALYHGDYGAAQGHFAHVEADAIEYSMPRLRARALVGLGLWAERQGQNEDALASFEEAEEFFRAHAPRPAAAEAVAGIARCHQMRGDHRFACHVLESFLIDLQKHKLEEPGALMRIYASLVWPYMELGMHGRASEVAGKALRLQSQVEAPEEIASMYLNVARVLLNEGKARDALESLRKAEEIYSALNWRTETARARHNRGMVYLAEGDLESARSELTVALDSFREVGYIRSEALVLNELARLQRVLGDREAAEDLARRALELLSDMEAVPELALAHRELALNLVRKDAETAATHLEKSIELYEASGEVLHAADTRRLLGDLLAKQQSPTALGQYRKALMLLADSLEHADQIDDDVAVPLVHRPT